MMDHSLDTFELARWESLQEQYMKEHFLSFYIACQMAGETTASDVGPPIEEQRFSLVEYIKQG